MCQAMYMAVCVKLCMCVFEAMFMCMYHVCKDMHVCVRLCMCVCVCEVMYVYV